MADGTGEDTAEGDVTGWTEEDIAAHMNKLKRPPVSAEAPTAAPAKAKGRIPWSPKMNGTERAYDSFLRTQYAAGEILWWAFEPFVIRLGPDCHFKPDFLVLYADSHLELHDTKGTQKREDGSKAYYSRDTGTIKARVTAMHFPIPIYFLFSTGDGSWGKKVFGE